MSGLAQEDKVILVDEDNNALGEMAKLEAHLKGKLHRAISILVFNKKGDFLLQRRAHTKYHSPGLWTNTCCSHPRPGESTVAAAKRRLIEEMGIACELKEIFSFTYYAPLNNGLIEHELDIVFFGQSELDPILDTEEASDFRWITFKNLVNDINRNPGRYTIWFRIIFDRLIINHKKQYNELFEVNFVTHLS